MIFSDKKTAAMIVIVVFTCIAMIHADINLAQTEPDYVQSLFYFHKLPKHPYGTQKPWEKSKVNGKDAIRINMVNFPVWLSYNIPKGINSLTALLYVSSNTVYNHKGNMQRFGYGLTSVNERIEFTIRINGQEKYSWRLDAGAPMLQISVPINGTKCIEIGSKPNIIAKCEWVEPVLSETTAANTAASFILPPGKDFISIDSPMYDYYTAGDALKIIYCSGVKLSEAKVNIKISEGITTINEKILNIPMAEGPSGTFFGTAVVNDMIKRCGVLNIQASAVNTGTKTGKLIGAVIPSEDPAAFSTEPILGVDTDTLWDYGLLSLLKVFGVRINRTHIRWAHIEPDKNNFTFETTDFFINHDKKNNMKTIWCLGGDIPEWAAIIAEGQKFDTRVRIKNMDDWKNFISNMIKQYKGKIPVWQVYNELDCKTWTKLDAKEILKSGYTIIKNLDPETPVLSLGGSQHGSIAAFIPELVTQGLANDTDGVSVHYYPTRPPEENTYQVNLGRPETYPGMLACLNDYMKKNNIRGKIWITENNYLGEPNKDLYDIQKKADWLARQFILSAASGYLDALCVHGLHNTTRMNPHARLIPIQIAAAARFVDGSQLLKKVDCQDPDVWAYIFSKKINQCLSIWSTALEKSVNVIPANNSFTMYDARGNAVVGQNPQSAGMTFTISESPVYITGKSFDNIRLQIRKESEFTITPAKFIAGETGMIKVKWTHLYGKETTGKFSLVSIAGWQTEPQEKILKLLPDAFCEFEFRVMPEINSLFRKYPFVLKSETDGLTRYIPGAVEVISPFSVDIKPFDTRKISRGVQVQLIVRNHASASLAGKIGFQGAASSFMQFPFLKSGEETTVICPLRSENDKYITVELICPPYRMISIDKNLLTCICTKTKEKITIDGNLSEWEPAGFTVKDIIELSADPTGHRKGDEDLSADFQTGWDDKYFYCAVQVRDNRHFYSASDRDALMYKNDSIQIAFDPFADKKKGGYYQYGFGGDTAGSDYWRWLANGYVESVNVNEHKPQGILYAVKLNAETAVYELAIPWNEIAPFHPSSGKGSGFAILINDNDGSGRIRWLEWAGGIGRGADPEKFGEIIFVE